MEVKVGIRDYPREVIVETEASAADVESSFTTALSENGLFVLTDDKGRKVLIPAATVAYVDLGQEHQRPVGFGAV